MALVHDVKFFQSQDNPPVPNNPDVVFTSTPEAIVYVAEYGGFMIDDKVITARTAELLQRLKADERSFNDVLVFTAEYDPPYRLQHRHNEIWVTASASGDYVDTS